MGLSQNVGFIDFCQILKILPDFDFVAGVGIRVSQTFVEFQIYSIYLSYI